MLKTITTKFNGVEYKIRNNFETLNTYYKLIKEEKPENEYEYLVAYAYSALHGFNEKCEVTLKQIAMYWDDPQNEQFLKDITEVINDGMEKRSNDEKEDGEKKN